MKVLKGLLISLLSFILFMSLYAFGLVFTLNATLLDPDFGVAEINKMDMPAITREFADSYLTTLPTEYQFMKQPVQAAVAEFAPVLKQQLIAASKSAYDYFLGKTDRLNVTISTDSLKTSLRDKARPAFMQNIPPQLAGQPPAAVDAYFNQAFDQFAKQLPPNFTLNESTLGPQGTANVRQARQIIGYARAGYWVLLVLMLLLIAAIILIHRDVKKATRELGVNFLIYGILGYATMLIGKYVINQYSAPIVSSVSSSMLMPKSLLSWLTQVMADVSDLTSLQAFSLAVLAVGVVLIVVSIVYRPRQAKA